MGNIMLDIGKRPLFLRHEMDGVARTEPKRDKYGSFFTMYSKKDDGTEYQISTTGERSKDFVTQGEEITEEEYGKARL